MKEEKLLSSVELCTVSVGCIQLPGSLEREKYTRGTCGGQRASHRRGNSEKPPSVLFSAVPLGPVLCTLFIYVLSYVIRESSLTIVYVGKEKCVKVFEGAKPGCLNKD